MLSSEFDSVLVERAMLETAFDMDENHVVPFPICSRFTMKSCSE